MLIVVLIHVKINNLFIPANHVEAFLGAWHAASTIAGGTINQSKAKDGLLLTIASMWTLSTCLSAEPRVTSQEAFSKLIYFELKRHGTCDIKGCFCPSPG
jgi:hypothetical protein